MLGSVRSSLETDAGLSPWLSTGLEYVGVGLAASALVLGGGMSGRLAAVGLVVAWLALPVEYAFATGHVALAVIGIDSVALGPLLAVEAGLVLLVGGSLWVTDGSWSASATWLLAYVALGGGVWYVAVESGEVWYAVVLLWAVVAATAYGLHRHELVTLGLTEGEHHR